MKKSTPPPTVTPDDTSKRTRRWFAGLLAFGGLTLAGVKLTREEPAQLVAVVTGVTEITRILTPEEATVGLVRLKQQLVAGPQEELPHDLKILDQVKSLRKHKANLNIREIGKPGSNSAQDIMYRTENPTLLMSCVLEHSMATSPRRKEALLTMINGLIHQGADVNAITQDGKTTALHMAVTQDDFDAAQTLLMSNQINGKARDLNGYTAIDYSQSEAMEQLLKNMGIKHSAQFERSPPLIYDQDGEKSPVSRPSGRTR